MKGFKQRLIPIFFLVAAAAALIFAALPINDFTDRGGLRLPGLTGHVTIQRDEHGMAYVHAGNLDDLLMAQGFVTAQDRLFQMQLTRLAIQGRVCELAGRAAKDYDVRMRTIGLHRMAVKHAGLLDDQTNKFFQRYVDGINGFIKSCPEDLQLEFKLAGIRAEKWTVADSLGFLYYMGYSTSANLASEITAQMLLETVGYEKACALMPVNINPDDPLDTGNLSAPSKDRLSPSPTGINDLVAYTRDRRLRTGSNNWAISPARSASGRTILAGDPHLDPRMLPGVWYPVGLIAPGIRAVGVQIPGIPGMTIGRTDHIALSVTNNYGDMVDLYAETPDPGNPDHYLEGERSIPFVQIIETLKIKDRDAPGGFSTEAITIRATRRGPVVSRIFPALKTRKLISLRFAPAEAMDPSMGLKEILTAETARELAQALKQLSTVCLNWVFADNSGNIGHQASGRIPIRHHQDGIFPFPVRDTSDNWHGWIPQDKMPGTLNPGKNWVGTCNQKTIPHDFPYYYSSYFAPSYRYRRLHALMAPGDKQTADDMWQYQRDTKNSMAEKIAPTMAKALMNHGDTASMGRLLASWDFRDDPDQAAPAIFQTVYHFFAILVFEDELGKENAADLLGNWYFWQERLEQMILDRSCPWFDNILTPDTTESPGDLFYLAAVKAAALLTQTLGRDPEKWQWGKIHTLELVNPLRRKGPGTTFLGTGPMPVGGSGETLYRGSYDFSAPFAVTHCASLRMVVDLADGDKILAVLPGGVSGRTFHPHQQDQVSAFMSGQRQYWWFSDRAIDEHETSKYVLKP